MVKIVRKRFISKLTNSFWSYFALIIFASLFTYSAIGAYHKSRLASEKMDLAQQNMNNFEDQKNKLVTELENANTDFGREKALREKFNVIKEGEQVIILVDDKNDTNSQEIIEKKSQFIQFFDDIFKK
jgi:cell division protein FtsB